MEITQNASNAQLPYSLVNLPFSKIRPFFNFSIFESYPS